MTNPGRAAHPLSLAGLTVSSSPVAPAHLFSPASSAARSGLTVSSTSSPVVPAHLFSPVTLTVVATPACRARSASTPTWAMPGVG